MQIQSFSKNQFCVMDVLDLFQSFAIISNITMHSLGHAYLYICATISRNEIMGLGVKAL